MFPFLEGISYDAGIFLVFNMKPGESNSMCTFDIISCLV